MGQVAKIGALGRAKDKIINSLKQVIREQNERKHAYRREAEKQALLVQQKVRTINSKNSLIGKLKHDKEFLRACYEQDVEELKSQISFRDKIIEVAIVNEAELKRRIKCLHERVRVRDIKIERFASGKEFSKVVRNNILTANELSKVRSEKYQLERKMRALRGTLARTMDKKAA